jgi:hypothetical protein
MKRCVYARKPPSIRRRETYDARERKRAFAIQIKFSEIPTKFTRRSPNCTGNDFTCIDETCGMQKNFAQATKHSRGALRLYECSRVWAVSDETKGLAKRTPRWQPRGRDTQVFPAVSPGRRGVQGAERTAPKPACQLELRLIRDSFPRG